MPPIDIQFWESIANKHTFFEFPSPFMLKLAQDRNLAELWFEGIERYESMDVVDQFRYQQLLFWMLNLYDDMYYQKQNNLMDDQMALAWESEIQHFLRDHKIKRFWDTDMRSFFRPDFQQLVEQKLGSA